MQYSLHFSEKLQSDSLSCGPINYEIIRMLYNSQDYIKNIRNIKERFQLSEILNEEQQKNLENLKNDIKEERTVIIVTRDRDKDKKEESITTNGITSRITHFLTRMLYNFSHEVMHDITPYNLATPEIKIFELEVCYNQLKADILNSKKSAKLVHNIFNEEANFLGEGEELVPGYNKNKLKEILNELKNNHYTVTVSKHPVFSTFLDKFEEELLRSDKKKDLSEFFNSKQLQIFFKIISKKYNITKEKHLGILKHVNTNKSNLVMSDTELKKLSESLNSQNLLKATYIHLVI